MATWDGSYSEPDGRPYYANSSVNQNSGDIQNWDYYTSNASNTFSQNAAAPLFELNNSLVFDSNTQNVFNHIDGNSISQLVPNVSTNTNLYTNNYTSNDVSIQHIVKFYYCNLLY